MADKIDAIINATIIILGIIVIILLIHIFVVDPNNGYFNHAAIYSPTGELIEDSTIKRYKPRDDMIEITFWNDEMYLVAPENVILKNTDKDRYVYKYVQEKEEEHDT